MISWSDLESAWKTSNHQWTTSINLFLIHTPSNNHWEPIGNPLGTHWEPIGNNGWVLPKNHAGSRCSATLLLKKLTQLCPQRSWQTWCVRLSETNFVNFVKQTKSLLKMLKRIWSEFEANLTKPAVSHDSEEPRDMARLLFDRRRSSNQKKNVPISAALSTILRIIHMFPADRRLQAAEMSEITASALAAHTSWSPADHQLITSLPADFEVDHLLSALSLISLMSLTVSHVSVFSSQAMWHAAVPKKIHIDLWIARPAWVPRGRHPCNGCFLTYNCCCAHLKTADSLMQ